LEHIRAGAVPQAMRRIGVGRQGVRKPSGKSEGCRNAKSTVSS